MKEHWCLYECIVREIVRGACSAGARHDSDLFSMQTQKGTVSDLVCYNKAFSTTTTGKF